MKRLLPLVLCFALAPAAARAGFNTPGIIDFDWLAEEVACPPLADLPADAPWVPAAAQAVFGSAASTFGAEGVLIWAAIPLEAPDGQRVGILQIDLDLAYAGLGTSLPVSSIRAEYVEKRGDEVLFFGTPAEGEVWLSDLIRSFEEAGAVLGHFEFLFDDPEGRYPGCRVLRAGTFVTNPSPEKVRQHTYIPPDQPGGDVYVESGCNGDVVIVDDGESCDCGGDDTSGSGCEGDSGSESSSCEGDSGSSGCEGDSGGSGCEVDTGGADCGGGGGGGCSGGGGGCEGAARAAVAPPRPRGGPIRLVSRFFPEIVVFGFITWMRRRNRR